MKLGNVGQALVAINHLMERECAYGLALSLVLLKKEIRELAEYYAAEEWKLAEHYAQRDAEGKVMLKGMNFAFRDPAQSEEYFARKRVLFNQEVLEGYQKIKAPAPEQIRPDVLEALADFILFEAGEKEDTDAAGNGLQ